MNPLVCKYRFAGYGKEGSLTIILSIVILIASRKWAHDIWPTVHRAFSKCTRKESGHSLTAGRCRNRRWCRQGRTCVACVCDEAGVASCVTQSQTVCLKSTRRIVSPTLSTLDSQTLCHVQRNEIQVWGRVEAAIGGVV